MTLLIKSKESVRNLEALSSLTAGMQLSGQSGVAIELLRTVCKEAALDQTRAPSTEVSGGGSGGQACTSMSSAGDAKKEDEDKMQEQLKQSEQQNQQLGKPAIVAEAEVPEKEAEKADAAALADAKKRKHEELNNGDSNGSLGDQVDPKTQRTGDARAVD